MRGSDEVFDKLYQVGVITIKCSFVLYAQMKGMILIKCIAMPNIMLHATWIMILQSLESQHGG